MQTRLSSNRLSASLCILSAGLQAVPFIRFMDLAFEVELNHYCLGIAGFWRSDFPQGVTRLGSNGRSKPFLEVQKIPFLLLQVPERELCPLPVENMVQICVSGCAQYGPARSLLGSWFFLCFQKRKSRVPFSAGSLRCCPH